MQIFLHWRNKNKTKQKKFPIEGSNSKPSAYENDALTARPVKYKRIGVILKS